VAQKKETFDDSSSYQKIVINRVKFCQWD